MKREAVPQDGTLKRRMADSSGVPKDVLLGVPIVTVTGRMEANIENYLGIIEYTDLLVRIKSKSGQIRISGKNLQIAYYTNDEMKITGHIEKVEYI